MLVTTQRSTPINYHQSIDSLIPDVELLMMSAAPITCQLLMSRDIGLNHWFGGRRRVGGGGREGEEAGGMFEIYGRAVLWWTLSELKWVFIAVAVAGISDPAGHAPVPNSRLLHNKLRSSDRTQQETGPGRQNRRRTRRQMQHRNPFLSLSLSLSLFLSSITSIC